jgi:hypothetical protein
MNAEVEQVAVEVEAAKPSAEVEANDEIRQLIDQFCAVAAPLRKKLAALGPTIKQAEKLEKALLVKLDTFLAPEVGATVPGNEYVLELTAKGKQLIVTSREKLLGLMGQGLFNETAKVSVEDMRRYLVDAELEQCTETQYNIKRKTKIEKLKKSA